MKALKGTGVAMVTPFDIDGNVDRKQLQGLTRHLVEGKVEFLVILGTTGESATLSEAEQEDVIDTVLEANAGALPFVLGAGGNDTAKVTEKVAKWTKMYRPDAFLSVSPYYNKPTQEGIYRHFEAVADATDLPVILYNVPGRTSSNMLPETVIRLATDFDNITSIKEASGNLEQGMEIVRGKPEGFSVLSGDDMLALGQVAAGFDGVISVAANALPLEFSEMVRQALAQDFTAARRSHYRIMRLMQLFFAEGNPAGIKAALEVAGICDRTVRLPLVPASDALKARIKKELAKLANS